MAVDVLSGNTDEQIALLHGAGIRLHRTDGDGIVALFGHAAEAALHVCECQLHEPSSSMAFMAASLSEKWMVSEPMIW